MPDPTPSISDGATNAPTSLHLGPFAVRASRGDVDAFRRETGWSTIGDAAAQCPVPQTFPMRWLSDAAIKSMLEAKLFAASAVAIHESQAFTYEQPLAIDQDYLMRIELDEQTNPARLILRATVATESGGLCLTMETILRLISAIGSSA